MTTLPHSYSLPVELLGACFQNTTNSYKFYWFLAILERIKTHQDLVIPVNDLKAIMIVNIWYPVIYFKLNFGKQDRLCLAAIALNDSLDAGKGIDKAELNRSVTELRRSSPHFEAEFRKLGRYVPFRFVEPFFRDFLRGEKDHKKNRLIVKLAEESFWENKPSIYRFLGREQESVELHPAWYKYFQRHVTILEDYTYWNLLKYLQSRNPHVPNIIGKLFPPQVRNLENARKLWAQAIQNSGKMRCIYSDKYIPLRGFSLDHFLPWRFVTHDLVWNILPTLPSVNSSKSDHLPDLARYFNRFSQIQFNALQYMLVLRGSHRNLLDDYILLFGCDGRDDLAEIPLNKFQERLYEAIAPQFQIAKNMGFVGDWHYPLSE